MDKSAQARIEAYIGKNQVETPCLIVSMQRVEENYRNLVEAIPTAKCHYAIKANPAAPILEALVKLGSNFDIASPQELDMCLAAGASATQVLYSNTIKKASEIRYAYEKGVRTFCFDAPAELEKIAEHAPGSNVLCRILTDGFGAAWPLSRKFGCGDDEAINMLAQAKAMGLIPFGVAFHVGSQMLELKPWDVAIERASRIFKAMAEQGIKLSTVNMGGGFPSLYRENIPSMKEIGAAIYEALDKHFGVEKPQILAEPGRYMAGDAGLILSEVILTSEGRAGDSRRWVFLDVGKFTGLIEAESIQYAIVSDKDHEPKGRVVIAGPTCDSVDVIYEEALYELPLSLKAGDYVRLLSTGAYTTTYSAVAFNGFPPLREIYID